MAANVIGHATLNVVPSSKGFGSALKGQIDPAAAAAGKSSGNAFGSVFKGVIGPLLAAAGVVGFGAFVGSAIKSAGALEQSIGAINSVFKGSATEMHGWAVGASTAVGMSRNEFNELGTLIGSQLKNAGMAMSDLGPKTNELIGLGADLASMFGGTSKDAVEAISSALKGERDPIEKYGVSLKQASIDAKAAELGFTKVGGALSAEANTAATLALIMEQTADAHGNFAKESTTYEGIMQRLKASWADITATIGGGFLPFASAAGSVLLSIMPTIQNLAYGFSTWGESMQAVFQDAGGGMAGIGAMFSSIGESISAWVTGGGMESAMAGFASLRDTLFAAVLGALPGILEALIEMAPSILTAAVASFSSLVTGLLTSIPPLITTLLGMAPSLITTLLGMVPILITAGLQLFMGLVQAVVLIIPQLVMSLVGMLPVIATTFLSMLPGILTAGLQLFQGLIDAVVQIVPLLITAVMDLLPAILTTVIGMLPDLILTGIELFLGLVTSVLGALPDLLVAIIGMLPGIISTLVSMIPQLIQGGIQLFKGLVQAIPRVLPEILNAIIFEVIPALVGAVIDAVPQLLQAGVDLIGGLVRGLWDAAGAVGEALLSIIGDAVDGFLSFLGIHSPSRLFRSFGGHIGDGLVLGLHDMEGDVASAALGLATAASRAVEGTELAIDAGVASDTAAALAELGIGASPHYETTYNDYSTSQEDKQAKLRRAQQEQERKVAATLGR